MDQRYNFSGIEADFKKYISTGNKILGRNTIKNYLSDLRYFLGWYSTKVNRTEDDELPALNASYFAQIDTKTIEAYTSYLELTQTSPETVKRRISSLSTFLSYCFKIGLIEENYVKSLKEANKKKTILENPMTDHQPMEPLQVANINESLIIPSKPLANKFRHKHILHIVALICAVVTIVLLLRRYEATSIAQFQPQKSIGGSRVLTYKGKLTDPLGNPITKKTDVRFKLYQSLTSDNALFESNNCTIYPEVDGKFEVNIGSSVRSINTVGCDKKIPDELFSSVVPLYLGVTVGTNAEMKPRQQISNVGLADNAMKVNGLKIGGGSNNIPYIDSSGDLSLTAENPSINATSTSQDFKITSSKSLMLQTGGDGDVILSATESGKIRFLTSGSDVDRMVIAQNGNVGLGTINPSYFKLEVSGSVGPSLTNTYNLGAPNRMWSSLYVNRICFDSAEKNCTSSLSTSSSSTSSASVASASASLAGPDFLVGGTATASANIKLSGTTGNPSFIRTGYLGINTTTPTSALDVLGSASFGGNVVDITTHTNEDLTLEANGTGIIALNNDTKVSGNFSAGVNVVSGTTTLDIAGTPTGYALCHSSQSGTDNQQIVDCSSTPMADFAEMYPVAQGSDYGDVMSLSPEEVKTTDGKYIRKLLASAKPYDNHLLGVVSDNYADFISVGHNLKSEDNPKPIALKGRVPVKVASMSDIIHAGDYLTTSSDRGKAMKATKAGVMIGTALEDWTPESGKNEIMVFVNTAFAVPQEDSFSPLQSLNKLITPEEKIISPIVNVDHIVTRELTTDAISPKNKDIHIDLSKKDASNPAELSKLVINGIDNQPVATIDAAGNLTSHDASFSGKLTADNIDSKNIKDLESRLASAVDKSTYSQDINSIQSALGEIKNTKLPDPSLYPPPPHGVVANESIAGLLDSLTVTGDTNLFNLSVHEKIYSLRDELKISALSSINFLDGAIVMTRDGNITLKGTLTAKEVKATKFSLLNQAGAEAASIDASGSARFANLSLGSSQNFGTPSAVIASEQNFRDNGVLLPAIETKQDSAGIGIVPANEPEVAVYNDGLGAQSLIFLTPTTDATASAALSVAKKITCEGTVEARCRPYFTVSGGTAPHGDLRFNWLILNKK